MLAADGWAVPLLTLETACPTMTSGGDAVLVEWPEENPHARLVIIDTYEKMRGSDASGMSAYAGDFAAAGRFKQLANHYSVPFLLIHHVRKQGAEDWQNLVSGTNGLTGAADATLVLERGRGQADGTQHVIGRDVEEADYAMTFDATAGRWTKLDGPAADHLVGDTRAQILRLLRDHGPLAPKAIAEALDPNPAASARPASAWATPASSRARWTASTARQARVTAAPHPPSHTCHGCHPRPLTSTNPSDTPSDTHREEHPCSSPPPTRSTTRGDTRWTSPSRRPRFPRGTCTRSRKPSACFP
ncbi:AAA family ATPase [Amycolatopsis vastitatis]|uniref:AAA family ATPase n=1 Tax=Amycolatopsis vastitatis TaxID=1905142 RepID=UPI001F0B0C6C|nr:AAA family ATPase [Amycolatopsis vastitatis]